MRLAGVDWLALARKLAADDPAINSDRIAYPQGYGIERYRKGQEPPGETQLIQAACKDVREALKERRVDLDHKAEDLREVEDARLDRLFLVSYRQAVKDGNLSAIDRALRIMERRPLARPRPACAHRGHRRRRRRDRDHPAALDELEALIGISEEAARGTE
jgi:hypothetical protein